jgi:hypothetical protein
MTMPNRPDLSIVANRNASGRRAWCRVRLARRATVLAAAIVTTAGFALAAMPATPAGAAKTAAATVRPDSSSPSWLIVKRVASGSSGGFTAVTAVGKNGGWAFDGISYPTAWDRNGSTWTQVPFPGLSNETVVTAAAASATDVWAFTTITGPSRVLRWNGRDWTVQRSFSRQITGAVVLSASNVWVFGEQYPVGGALGTWHYNGRTWSPAPSGYGLAAGSALSADDIWAFSGTDVAHWNGHTWSRTSVASLLPAKQLLNDPAVVGIDALSPASIYAIGSGNLEDEGGPTVILHYNGHSWSKVAEGYYGPGTQPVQQVSSDGHGGLWLPMPGYDGQKSYLVHYSDGRLTEAALPGGPDRIDVVAVALIPGTTDLLGVGDTHAYETPGTDVTDVILQYGT